MGVSSTKSPKLSQALRREAAVAWLRAAPWKVASMRGVRALPVVDGEEALPHPPRKGMRIFTKGCPIHLMQDVIDILSSETVITDPVADGSVISGTWYHRIAVWNRDAGTSETGDATKTLIRDLGDGPLSFAAVAEDGCSSITTIRYYWDAVELISPDTDPNHGMQGFSVRIGGVSRDMETGWFNYFVTVTERKTTHTPEYLSGSDAFGDIYTESWTGLRGTQDAPEDDNGDPVYVPGPEGSPAGSEYNVEWSKNPEDCTWSAQARWTRSKKGVKGSESCSVDLFRHVDTVETQAQGAKLGHAPEPAYGVKTRHVSRRRKDRLFDNTVEHDAERTVLAAREVSAVTVFGSETSYTDKSTGAATPAASAGSGRVKRVTVDKTPGAMKDITVSEQIELPYDRARVSKASDVFGTQETHVDRAQPGSEPSVPAPGGGASHEVSSEVTDGGRRNNTSVVKTETPYAGAVVTKAATVFEEELSTTDRAQSSAPAAPVAGGGYTRQTRSEVTPGGLRNNVTSANTEKYVASAVVDTDATIFKRARRVTHRNSPGTPDESTAGAGILFAVRGETTPGGRKNITESTEQSIPVAAARRNRRRTVFETRDAITDVNQLSPAPEPSAGGGTIVSVSSDLNPDGSRQIVKETSVDIPYPRARVTKAVDAFGIQETRVDRAQPDVEPIVPEAANGVTEEASSEVAEGGLRNNTIASKTETPFPDASGSDEVTVFQTVKSRTAKSSVDAVPESTAADGVRVATRFDVTPGRLKNITATTVTEIPVQSAVKTVSATVFDVDTTIVSKSQPEALATPTAGDGVTRQTRSELTPGGLVDVSLSEKEEKFVAGAEVTKSKSVFKLTTRTVDRSSPAAPPEPSASAGVSIAVTGSRTPGGRTDITTVKDESIQFDGAKKSRQKTIFEERLSDTDVNTTAEVPEHTASDGIIISGSEETNEDGNRNVVRNEIKELEVLESSVNVEVLPWMKRRSVTDTNVASPHDEDSAGFFGGVQYSRTPGGRYTRVKTSVSDIKPGTVLSHSKTGNIFSTTEVIRTIETVKDFGVTGLRSSGVEGAANIRTVEFDYDPAGYYIKTETIETVGARQYVETSKLYYNSETDLNVTVWFFQYVSISEAALLNILGSFDARGELKMSYQTSMNKFGLYSGLFHYKQSETD